MTSIASDGGYSGKSLIAVILAAVSLILLAIDRSTDASGAPAHNIAAAQADASPIYAELDSLLSHEGIQRRAVTSWRVMTPDKKFIRTEQRIVVGPDFVTVRFNHELAVRIAPYGARVVATERTKERTVTMHIVKDRVVIRTVSFVARPQV